MNNLEHNLLRIPQYIIVEGKSFLIKEKHQFLKQLKKKKKKTGHKATGAVNIQNKIEFCTCKP